MFARSYYLKTLLSHPYTTQKFLSPLHSTNKFLFHPYTPHYICFNPTLSPYILKNFPLIPTFFTRSLPNKFFSHPYTPQKPYLSSPTLPIHFSHLYTFQYISLSHSYTPKKLLSHPNNPHAINFSFTPTLNNTLPSHSYTS